MENREVKFRAFDDGIMVYPTGAMANINRFFRVIREDAIFMQYTGLKDKNGKEIYEGDVVIDNGCDYEDDKFVVTFSDGAFYPLVYVEEGYNCIDRYNPKRFEVIGNVFESPTLLKKK